MKQLALLVLLVLGYLVASTSTIAQRDQMQGIPPDVVSLLLRIGGMAGTDSVLRAGGPGPDFPTGLFPDGTVLNATLTSPTRGTTVIGTAAKLDIADADKREAALVAAGWISTGPRMRGLVSAMSTSMPMLSLCRGTDFVTMSFYARDAGGVHIRATSLKDPRRSCAAVGFAQPLADVDLPRLVPPPGARAVGGGSGGGGLDSFSSALRLETSLSVQAVVEHYEQQLVAAGWKVAGRVRDASQLASTRFDVPSSIDQPATGWFTATVLTGVGDVDVFLRVVRNARDPRATPGIVGGVSTTLVPTSR